MPSKIINREIMIAFITDVQKNILEEEYRISWQDGSDFKSGEPAYRAANGAHGFQLTFTETGLRIVPQRENDPPWETNTVRQRRIWAKS